MQKKTLIFPIQLLICFNIATISNVEPILAAIEHVQVEILQYLLSIVDANLKGPTIKGRCKLDINAIVQKVPCIAYQVTELHAVMEVTDGHILKRNLKRRRQQQRGDRKHRQVSSSD